jgi:hypothetical protein
VATPRNTSAGAKRKTSASKSTNSDSDTEVALPGPVVSTKKYRLENGKSVKLEGNDPSQRPRSRGPTVTSQPASASAEKENPNSHTNNIQSHRRATRSHRDELVDADIDSEATRGAKRAATQLKAVPKARVSFASARTISKPFIPLDPASIRRGFQEGGASSKKEDLKKSTYIMLI